MKEEAGVCFSLKIQNWGVDGGRSSSLSVKLSPHERSANPLSKWAHRRNKNRASGYLQKIN